MAISPSRTRVEKLVESSKVSGSNAPATAPTPPSSLSDLEPKGLTDLLPAGFSQFSNFKDLMKFAAKDIRNIYAKVNQALTMKNLSDFKLGMNNPLNFNANPVNSTLGIFHALLCGDSKGFDFRLRDLIRALEYDFGFLNFNICGRQKLRNPVDIFINSVDNLRKDYNALINLDKRIMKNLQKGVDRFIKGLGLPKNLEECMLDNALSNMIIKNRETIPPGALSNLKKALNPDICKRSDDGVPGYNRTMEKVKITPLVTGLTKYNEETMLSFHGAILNEESITNDIVMEVICSTITDKDRWDLHKTLQLIAFTKIAPLLQNDLLGDSIGAITNNIHKVDNASSDILDKILAANESDTILNPIDTVKVSRPLNKVDMDLSLEANSSTILEHMKDDLNSYSSDPEKDFYNCVKLIKIADPKFQPEKSVLDMGNCPTLKDLAVSGASAKTYKPTKPSEEVTEGSIKYIKIHDEISLMDQVAGCF